LQTIPCFVTDSGTFACTRSMTSCTEADGANY